MALVVELIGTVLALVKESGEDTAAMERVEMALPLAEDDIDEIVSELMRGSEEEETALLIWTILIPSLADENTDVPAADLVRARLDTGVELSGTVLSLVDDIEDDAAADVVRTVGDAASEFVGIMESLAEDT